MLRQPSFSTSVREPLHPVLRNALIMFAAGVAASMLCAKVYGAVLPPPVVTAPVETASTVET